MPARHIEVVSGLNMYDVGIGFPQTNNLLCCLPCQSVTVTFQNVHNTSLHLTQINIASDPWLLPTVTAINGGAPTLPITIASGATFTVTFQLCVDSNFAPTSYWKFFFVTTEHTMEDFYYVPMTCVTIDDLTSVSLMSFGDVIPNVPATQSGQVSNSTIGSFAYTIDFSGCPDITGTNLSGTIVPGQTIAFTVTWSPTTYPEILNCTGGISLDANRDCSTKITLDGQTVAYDCDPEGGICCLNVTLNTENGYLDSQNALCDADFTYNSAAILEKKQIIYDLKYFEPITFGTAFYFNPYLFSVTTGGFNTFLTSGNPPPQYYALTYSLSAVTGTPYAMLLYAVGFNTNNQKNIQAYITFVDPANGIFRITLDFYVVSDRNFMINNSVFSNKFKYQKSTLNDTSIYNNTVPSVYTQDEYLSSYFMVVKNLVKTDYVHNLPFTARFYNKGLYDNVSEFQNPVFNLSRNVGLVTELSIYEATKITFTINVDSSYLGCDHIIFHLVDETLDDNTLQFIAATDASRAEIQNNAGPAVLNNHLIAPSTFNYLGSDVYEATCYVDININPTHQYRVFAIVYGGDGVTVNTFKSASYKVRSIPEYDCDCKPEITSYWDNYFESKQTDDYRPVGKERIQHRLVLKEGTITECLTNWGISIPDWRVALTSIKLRIYKRYLYFPPDPNQDYATFFEFGNYVSTRNNVAVGNWDNFTSLNVLDVNTDEIHVSINNVRVRWENTSFNGNVSQCKMDTYMDKYPITGAQATSYVSTLNVLNTWIDEDVYFEYEFEFDLSSYFGSFFKFHICRAFMARAISFENFNSGFPTHIISQYMEGYDTTINTWVPLGSTISASAYSLLRITYTSNDAGPLYGWFNFFIETLPFGLPMLVESNATNSPTGLLNNGLANIVVNQSINYSPSGSIAQVVIDTSMLQNTSYLFCGYWSEMFDVFTCDWFNVHTRANGSPQIQMLPTPTYADYFTLTLFSATTNNYVYITSLFGASPPLNGQTYTLHYAFGTPTTQGINIWLGQFGTAGLPNIVIPSGSQVGIITFVWPFVNNGNWTIKLVGGTDVSGYWSFAIGGADCATSPFE